jgi:hypothetical protein
MGIYVNYQNFIDIEDQSTKFDRIVCVAKGDLDIILLDDSADDSESIDFLTSQINAGLYLNICHCCNLTLIPIRRMLLRAKKLDIFI